MTSPRRAEILEALDLAGEMQRIADGKSLAIIGVAAAQLLAWAICQHQSQEARRALAKDSFKMVTDMIDLIPIEQ